MRLLQEAGPPDGVINLVHGAGADDRRRRARAAETSPASTSPARPPVFQSMWKTIGDEHRPLPQLPAHRRRDRRQGLHRRAPVRRRRRARDRDRARLVRVPGAEVLGRVARLRRRRASGRTCASGSPTRSARIKMGDVADFSNFMGAVIDGRRVRDAARGDRGRAASRRREVLVGGEHDDSEGFFVEPTVIETDDPRLPAHAARSSSGRSSRAYVYPDERVGARRSSSSTTTAPYGAHRRGLRATTARAIDEARRGAPLRGRQLLRQRQADRRRRRPAAVRRRARVGHERQGGLDVEPDPLGQPAHDQGDVRPADATTATRSSAPDSVARRLPSTSVSRVNAFIEAVESFCEPPGARPARGYLAIAIVCHLIKTAAASRAWRNVDRGRLSGPAGAVAATSTAPTSPGWASTR